MELKKDVEWLLSICKTPKDLKYLEPCCHAFSIFFAMREEVYSQMEIAKLSLIGIIATTARMNDEDKFHNLDPFSFIQVANALLDEEDNGDNYSILIKKIIGESNINTLVEDKTNGQQ